MKAKILYNMYTQNNEYSTANNNDKIEPHYELKRGDIVEVNIDIRANGEDVSLGSAGMCYLCKHHGQYDYIPATCLDIDFSGKDIDWEERRYEIAKSAMNGLLSSCKYDEMISMENYNGNIIWSALSYADELIRRLKMKL